LGDRAQQVFHFQPSSSNAGYDTGFSMLWELAWPARFPGGLENLIVEPMINSISNELREAGRTGFIAALEVYCQHDSSPSVSRLVEELAKEVFQSSDVTNLILNWISSGWIDFSGSDVAFDNEKKLNVTHLLNEARLCTLNAMRALYDNLLCVAAHDSVFQSLKLIFECRKKLHETVMSRLNQPNLTNQTGMKAFFAKIYFEDCDKNLRLIYSVLKRFTSSDNLIVLKRLIGIETQ
jgi:hypothetical protein